VSMEPWWSDDISSQLDGMVVLRVRDTLLLTSAMIAASEHDNVKALEFKQLLLIFRAIVLYVFLLKPLKN
jgi:hypothetical protein